MEVGTAESQWHVIHLDNIVPDDLAIHAAKEQRLREMTEKDACTAQNENLKLKERSVAEYKDDIATIEDFYGVTYNKSRPYNTITLPDLEPESIYNVGTAYGEMVAKGRVFMACQELAREQQRLTAMIVVLLKKTSTWKQAAKSWTERTNFAKQQPQARSTS